MFGYSLKNAKDGLKQLSRASSVSGFSMLSQLSKDPIKDECDRFCAEHPNVDGRDVYLFASQIAAIARETITTRKENP